MSMLLSVFRGSVEFGTAYAMIMFLMTLSRQIPENTISQRNIGVSHFNATSRLARAILMIMTNMIVSIVRFTHILFFLISSSRFVSRDLY